jgi:hypothetical protein
MKVLLSFFLLLSGSLLIKGQNSITVWYSMGPTSGCNGVMAISNTQYQACINPPPATYNFNPPGCGTMTGSYIAGDTFFIPLCQLPCTLYTINGNGQISPDVSGKGPYLDPFTGNLVTSSGAGSGPLAIFRISGERVFFLPSLPGGSTQINTGFPPGIYILSYVNERQELVTGKYLVLGQ